MKALRNIAVALALGVAAAALPATPAMAYNTLGCKFGVSGNSLRWQDATNSSSYASAATQAINAWNSTSTQFNFAKVTSSPHLLVADGNFGATWNGASFSGIILDMNQQNPIANSCGGGTWDTSIVAWWNRYYTNAYGATKKQAIIVHEIGHALGLAHTTSVGCGTMTIMDWDIDAGFDSCGFWSPRADDINGANALY